MTTTVHAAAASTGFLGVDWGSIVLVFFAVLIATFVIVAFYSLGLRLLAIGSPDDGSDQGSGATVASVRPVGATIGGFACIAVGAAAVLYGIYLVIPIFHQ